MSSTLRAAKVKAPRERLDKLLVARGYAQSRERAHAMILAGQVWVEGRPSAKAGLCLPLDVEIELHGSVLQYASRGGLKLEHALAAFSIQPVGWVAMDAGASTGGFTDCLLQHGVKKVYAVDVGYGQLAWRLRQDPRVVVIERTNIRYMTEKTVPEKVDLITVDLSFISLRLVLPKLLAFLKSTGPFGKYDDPSGKCNSRIVALVKPQFEVGKGQVGRGGLVKDTAKHQEVLEMISQAAAKTGLTVEGITASPLLGRKGNQEYFICLKTGPLREI
ncbi:MAG TPA: TlyA family RNA methyltransferase [Nitrospiria bacterium]|jgi:23S rRNA (cytidine1920-2'-O)/16S rRNA (cytidine1409-2'-O)-methyltransferase|nr:TlyA family RNA methyltransferase [Nitrospiria bacterium]